MKDNDINDFIEWLGVLYLDFDNENDLYKISVTNEIKEKIKSYK